MYNQGMTDKPLQLSAKYEVTLVEILKNLDAQSAYTLTMPLLLVSVTKRVDDYRRIMAVIKKKLGFPDVEKITKNAWLLGRLLISSQAIGDQETQDAVLPVMQRIVNTIHLPKDAFRSWAIGYLGTYYATNGQYESFKDELLNAPNIEKKNEDELSDQVDLLFVYVMVLQAVTISKDEEMYRKLVIKLNDIERIPVNDFRAWAMS